MGQLRGVRGATTADGDTREAILSATADLLKQMVVANGIVPDDVACAFFTVTPDLTAAFPAEAARARMGWSNGAFMDAVEIPVPGAQTRCIRVLLLVNTDKPSSGLNHVYLKGAQGLRSRNGQEGPPGFRAQ